MKPGHSAHKPRQSRLRASRGFSLLEMVAAATIMGAIAASVATLHQYMIKVVMKENTSAQAGEQARQALEKAEIALVHANQIVTASSTFVQFIADIDQSPNYNPNAFGTNAGKPQSIANYLNADRDGDASSIMPASAAWQVGYNLKDDDEDGDGHIDVEERLYLSSSTLWLDMSVNGSAWGTNHLKQLYVNVSTFTLTYYGSYANIEVGLGKNIDYRGNNIIDAYDMDHAPPTARSTYNDGVLDDPVELAYITQIHIVLGSSYMSSAGTEYLIESDVYPPLMAIKPYAQ